MPVGCRSNARPADDDRVPDPQRRVPRHPDLVAEIAGVTGARHVHRDAGDVAAGGAEILQRRQIGVAHLRAAAAPTSAPAAPARRRFRRCPRSPTFRPDAFSVSQRRFGSAAVQRNACSRQPRHRAIVDDLAVLVAPRRVVDLADAHLRGVARDDAIDEAHRVGAGDAVLVERRDVDQRAGVPDRVVFVLVMRLVGADGVVAGPVAVVEALAQLERARVESGTDGHRESITSGLRA